MKSKRNSKPSAKPAPPWRHLIQCRIKRIVVVGAGGTGSIFLSHLCRIWSAWTKLGGRAFEISIYDNDIVTESNLARQVFCEADIGSHKAAVIAQRMRAFYGIPVEYSTTKWISMGYEHDEGDGDRGRHTPHRDDTLLIGCVDNLSSRRDMAKRKKGYWLDMGNDAHTGQVVLGGYGLPNFFDLHPKLKTAKDAKTIPSCSMAESLERQDLFVNSTVATLGGQLLWQLMRKGGINHHGHYINLASGRVVPIPVK